MSTSTRGNAIFIHSLLSSKVMVPVSPAEDRVHPDTFGGSKHGCMCECLIEWVRHHCLAHAGMDPILYDVLNKISDLGFIPLGVIPKFLGIGFLFSYYL